MDKKKIELIIDNNINKLITDMNNDISKDQKKKHQKMKLSMNNLNKKKD